MNNNLPKIISWIVGIALIAAIAFYFSGIEKNPGPKERYIENIRAKYEVYEEEPYDYFRGFDAGIKWAKENPEKIASSTSYEETIMETSYDNGYQDGYNDGYEDGAAGESMRQGF